MEDVAEERLNKTTALARDIFAILQQSRTAALTCLKARAPTLKLGHRQQLINAAAKQLRESGGVVDIASLTAAIAELVPDADIVAQSSPAAHVEKSSPSPPPPQTVPFETTAPAPTDKGSAPTPPVPPTSNLACFIACHASSTSRAADLERSLSSLLAQSPRAPRVLVSWSAAPSVAAEVRTVLRSLASRGLPLEHFEQRGARRSQFEHLERLCAYAPRARGPPIKWVAFADDDDISSERRFALLAAECAQVDGQTKIVQCVRKARPTSALDTQPADAAAVRALLASGEAAVTDARQATASDGATPSAAPRGGFHAVEYFDLVVRLEVLRDFFTRVDERIVRHRFCDLALTFLVKEGTWGPTHTFDPLADGTTAADEFVYFYGRSQAEVDAQANGLSSAAASVGLSARALERHIAAASAPAVAALLAHLGEVKVDMNTLRAYTGRVPPSRSPLLTETQRESAAALDVSDAGTRGLPDEDDEEAVPIDKCVEHLDPYSMEARLLRLLADLRQGIESELVQLRAGANVLRASMSDGVAKREGSLAIPRSGLGNFNTAMRLEQTPDGQFEYGDPACNGCFRAWVYGVARGPLLHAAMRTLGFAAVYNDTDDDLDTKMRCKIDEAKLIRLDKSLPVMGAPMEEGEPSRVIEDRPAKRYTGTKAYDGGRLEGENFLAWGLYYRMGRHGAPPAKVGEGGAVM